MAKKYLRKTRKTYGSPAKRSSSIKKHMLMKSVKNRVPTALINAVAVIAVVLLLIFIVQTFFGGKSLEGSIDDISAFRMPVQAALSILELSEKYDIDSIEMITLYSLEHNFFPDKQIVDTDTKTIEKNYILNYTNIKDSYGKDTFSKYYGLFKDIMGDIVYFPVPYGYDEYMYGDSFKGRLDETNYGCEILDRENQKGRLPVVSMTAGVVESVGYDDTNGHYVTITAPSGGKYYYGRLDTVKEQISKGVNIPAGTVIGFMGESKNSASSGVFIAVNAGSELFNESVWVNPYVFLRIVEHQNNRNETIDEK